MLLKPLVTQLLMHRAVCLIPLFFFVALPTMATSNLVVDEVKVIKSDRQLFLMEDGEAVREYPISLGRNPKGHKLYEGDNRTPEGRYKLDWRNANSDFHKSIHISYPNDEDRYLAESWGLDPGGSIMIHGLPNDAEDWAFAYEGLDWTDGCIAVSNQDIEEIWELVPTGTPIEIHP